ncbi:hypothetical protein VKS41_000763 [Umbelopsis sp. WA50703]
MAPRNTDPTINMLYRISLDVYTKILDQDLQSVNELKQLNDVYYAHNEKILSLLKDENTSKSNIVEYLSQFSEYNKQQKRKLDELLTEDDLEEYQIAGRSKNQRADEDEQATTSDYTSYELRVTDHWLRVTSYRSLAGYELQITGYNMTTSSLVM